MGKRATVSLQQREWNGQVRNEVKKVMPPLNGANVASAPAAATPAAPTAAPAPAHAPSATSTPIAPF